MITVTAPVNIIVSRAEVLKTEPNKIRIYFRPEDNVILGLTSGINLTSNDIFKIKRGVYDLSLKSSSTLSPGDFTVTSGGNALQIKSVSFGPTETDILMYGFRTVINASGNNIPYWVTSHLTHPLKYVYHSVKR